MNVRYHLRDQAK